MIRQDIMFIIPAVIIALIQLIIWHRLTERSAYQETKIAGAYAYTDVRRLQRLKYGIYVIFGLQLIFPFLSINGGVEIVYLIRFTGYIMVFSGFALSLIAIEALGKSWSGMFTYRIIKNQKLITTGIYGIIRHPIYLAFILEVIGYEFVVVNWLGVPLFIGATYIIVEHIKKEDILLQKAFGAAFITYKKNTAALVPFLY